MRNLLGRLHARRQPELLRIADAWGVPLHGESKGEIIGTLYRAMTDPRAVRDIWNQLSADERAMATALADAPDTIAAPTINELAARLSVDDDDARQTALALYHAGILAREGDDDPLPVGAAPRLLMPREVSLNVRRIQDELEAGDLSQTPLRVLVELLDDGELEAAARTWGMRLLPGVSRREDLTNRLLRQVNDGRRLERVAKALGRDAAAIWKVVQAASDVVPLPAAAAAAGLAGGDKGTVARLRAALAELEGALLVWHTFRADGTRWLFVPLEIRYPGEAAPATAPPLEPAPVGVSDVPVWRHPDAFAWDLLTLLRMVTSAAAPAWSAVEPPPRWLKRIVAPRFWFGHREDVPTGYLELMQAVGLAEGVLALDEDAKPPRIVPSPRARDWRRRTFPELSASLRERWLRLPRWIEGEPAGIVEVWGADWRGMRPRLLAALADAEIGATADDWVTLESLSARIAARFPALLGPSFTAATARLAGEAGAGADVDEARAAALGDIIALELAGPFAWFGLTQVVERVGHSRAVRLTPAGEALARRTPWPAATEASAPRAPLLIEPSGEIALHAPSPERVWALSAFAEQVSLGATSYYRLTSSSVAAAFAAGVEQRQIVEFLERGSRLPLPHELDAKLEEWARARRQADLRRAVVVTVDRAPERTALLANLQESGWHAELLGEHDLLVLLSPGERTEEMLVTTLRDAGHVPRWDTPIGGQGSLDDLPVPAAGDASLGEEG